jgi:hypothetical protein
VSFVRARAIAAYVERLLASARQLPQLRCLAFLNPWDLQSLVLDGLCVAIGLQDFELAQAHEVRKLGRLFCI